MTYAVKEIFYTLQGEGVNAGRPAVLLRFSGCNLWTGRVEDRADAVCGFCDTDFVGTDGSGGGRYLDACSLADVVEGVWPTADENDGTRLVVCTGGEPMLQLDGELVAELQQRRFTVALETNGTIVAPEGTDWICVSPKAGACLKQKVGDELKLVYPQSGLDPSDFEHLTFEHFLLQPLDGPNRETNTRLALNYCLKHPRWRLSIQTHKVLNIQ